MVEWYRCGDDMMQGVRLLSDLVCAVLRCQEAHIITYRGCFEAILGVDPIACDESELDALLRIDANRLPHGLDRDGKLEWLFTERIQPTFTEKHPTIVTNYPLSQGALAQQSPTEPGTAERFELFYAGIELANGYGELRDAVELSTRFGHQNELRKNRGVTPLPIPEKLLAAMRSGLPACTGCALGLERLMMVLYPGTTMERVTPFPAHRL